MPTTPLPVELTKTLLIPTDGEQIIVEGDR